MRKQPLTNRGIQGNKSTDTLILTHFLSPLPSIQVYSIFEFIQVLVATGFVYTSWHEDSSFDRDLPARPVITFDPTTTSGYYLIPRNVVAPVLACPTSPTSTQYKLKGIGIKQGSLPGLVVSALGLLISMWLPFSLELDCPAVCTSKHWLSLIILENWPYSVLPYEWSVQNNVISIYINVNLWAYGPTLKCSPCPLVDL